MSFIDTVSQTVTGLFTGTPSADQQREIAETVVNFPATFDRAVADWAKFKAGVKAGLFTQAQRAEILEWFRDFPKLWETIRPNFVITRTPQGAYLPLTKPEFANKVDLFVARLKGESVDPGLGIAPIIIAGVIIAGALGLAGAFWAVAYMQRQANISKMVDEVTAGRLPVGVLQTAIEQEAAFMTPIGELGNVVKWLALGVAAYFIVPVVAEVLRGKKS